jgi:precorrin-6A/cobalt-precorrin-6A reductase
MVAAEGVMRVLLLGGTTEAGELALALAQAGVDAVYSYAGRTERPAVPPIPYRVGGFGGVRGLTGWLRDQAISHVIDATHPFAAQMSRHAVLSCADAGLPLIAFARPAWQAQPGDRWTHVPDMTAACAALPQAPARVFLAIGRLEAVVFAACPQHDYLLRLVDAAPVPGLARARSVIARGPFTLAGDLALMRDHGTEIVVAKNAGGTAARAKLDAARALDLPVILIDRPVVPDGPRLIAGSVDQVMAHLGHPALRGV